MSRLDNVVQKPNAPNDYDSFLKWVWANYGQRPQIYTTETEDHFWTNRVTEPRSR